MITLRATSIGTRTSFFLVLSMTMTDPSGLENCCGVSDHAYSMKDFTAFSLSSSALADTPVPKRISADNVLNTTPGPQKQHPGHACQHYPRPRVHPHLPLNLFYFLYVANVLKIRPSRSIGLQRCISPVCPFAWHRSAQNLARSRHLAAALAPPAFALCERGNYATKRANFLICRVEPSQQRAEILCHDGFAMGRIEKPPGLQFAFQMFKKANEFFFRRRSVAAH